MDEPAHADEPGSAEPKEAKDQGADAALREPVADAIPTVAPYEPRLPTQAPPLPEEGAAADGAGDEAGGRGADTPAFEAAVHAVEADTSGPAEEDPFVPVEAEVSEWPPSMPLREASPEPFVSPVIEAESVAAVPAATDADIFATAPTEPVEHSHQSDASSRLDGHERSAETPVVTEVQVPIRSEQIWSAPEIVVPLAEADVGAERVASAEQPTLQAALIETAPAPVQPVWPPRPALSWPSASLPSKESVSGALSYLRLALRVVIAAVLTLTVTVLMLVILYRWVDPPASTLMLGQRLSGTPIEQKWVPLDRISPHLVHAVILSEDGAFCRHHGVDWSALEEAIESSRGGSTITMQVVKNLFLWPARSYVRKALEIILAYAVEVVWPKQRVLEIYLNIAEWGPGVFGAEAAARHHFGKRASQLTAQESALLAVSLPSPIERQAGYPGWQTRRLADNLLIRMRAVRTTMRCVQVRRTGI